MNVLLGLMFLGVVVLFHVVFWPWILVFDFFAIVGMLGGNANRR